MTLSYPANLSFRTLPLEPCHFKPGIVKAIAHRRNPGEKSAESETAAIPVSCPFRRFLALVTLGAM